MTRSTSRSGLLFCVLLLSLLAIHIHALPHGEYDARQVDPVKMGFSQEYVREVEEKYGHVPWLARPQDPEEDRLWRIEKRQLFDDPCGGLPNSYNNSYFIGRPGNKLFQIKCGMCAGGGTAQVANGGGPSDPWLPNIMAAIDRCSDPFYFNMAGGGCRALDIKGANNRVLLYKSHTGTYGPVVSSTRYAYATYITEADCNFNTVASPLMTLCGPLTGGGWNAGPARSTHVPGPGASMAWDSTTAYGDRVPTGVASAATCAGISPNAACPGVL